jgi:hypothetical protein
MSLADLLLVASQGLVGRISPTLLEIASQGLIQEEDEPPQPPDPLPNLILPSGGMPYRLRPKPRRRRTARELAMLLVGAGLMH